MNPKLKVLILDDETAIRDSISYYLEDFGIHVFPASTVREARKILSLETIEAAIVDLRLTDASGEDFILATLKEYPNLKYLIHTGMNDYEMDPILGANKRVSDTIFLKPLQEMEELYREILRITEYEK